MKMLILCFNERELTCINCYSRIMLGQCWELIAVVHLLKIRTSIDIFGTEKCNVTFGLKYIHVKGN